VDAEIETGPAYAAWRRRRRVGLHWRRRQPRSRWRAR
jgi:hypothetical protein